MLALPWLLGWKATNCLLRKISQTTMTKSSLEAYTPLYLGAARDGKASARDVILPSLRSFPKPSSISPGTILVWGEDAEPLLSGDVSGDVILAAVQSGTGRVVVFSHEYYLCELIQRMRDPQIKALFVALARWLLPSAECISLVVFDKNSSEAALDELDTASVLLLWRDSEPLTKTPDWYIWLERWVKRGGALVLGYCPWGWCQVHPQHNLDLHCDMQRFVTPLGLCFTSNVASITDDKVNITNNPSNKAHLARNVRAYCQGSHVGVGTIASPHLPQDIKKKFLSQLALSAEPTPMQYPLKQQSARERCSDEHGVLIARGEAGQTVRSPDVGTFPGLCDSPTNSSPLLRFSETRKNREWHSTGFYAPPGSVIRVDLHTGEASCWSLQIGCHSDELNATLTDWPRPPVVCVSKQLSQGLTELCSPFGGLIYLCSQQQSSTELVLTLHNVVKSPTFSLPDACRSDGSIEAALKQWRATDRLLGAPWGELRGNFCILSLPASCLKPLLNPDEVIQFWDTLVKETLQFRGKPVVNIRPERYVCDVKMSMEAYMHSGYPIVTLLDVASTDDPKRPPPFVDLKKLTTEGNWGAFHELGHNMQEPSWTFAGVVEVTVNIFTLHAMRRVCGVDPWLHPWLCQERGPDGWKPKLEKFFSSGAKFSTWCADPHVALFVYAQLYHSFGWKLFADLFRRYDSENKTLNGQQNVIDEWWRQVSHYVGKSLAPLCAFWGIPLSNQTKEELAVLRPLLPWDDVTQHFPTRVNEVRSDYQNMELFSSAAPLVDHVQGLPSETKWLME